MNTRYSFTPKGKGYKIYSTSSNPHKSKRSTSKSSETLGIFFVPILIISGFLSIIMFLVQNIVAVLIVVGIVIIIGIIYILIKNIEANNKKKQEYIAIINKSPIIPTLIQMPNTRLYSTEFQKDLLKQFANHIQYENNFLHADSQYSYLIAKVEALRALHRKTEADAYLDEISTSYQYLLKCKQNLLETKYHDLSGTCISLSSLKYMQDLKPYLSAVESNVITRFFSSDALCLKSDVGDSLLVFTNHSAILCSPDRIESFCMYGEINVSSTDYTEMLDGRLADSDEIDSIHWLYETKKGQRDMRYSDNPRFTYVHRNRTLVSYKKFVGTIFFSNRKNAKLFRKFFEGK